MSPTHIHRRVVSVSRKPATKIGANNELRPHRALRLQPPDRRDATPLNTTDRLRRRGPFGGLITNTRLPEFANRTESPLVAGRAAEVPNLPRCSRSERLGGGQASSYAGVRGRRGEGTPASATGRKMCPSEMTISENSPFAGTVINVKDHDATGDGSTDDTDHLRDAIAASRVGDAIYFPPGTYLISKRLVTNAKQVYFSLTDAATIKVKAPPGSEPFAVFEVKSGPVEFHHLTFDLSESQPPKEGKEAPPGILAQAADAGTVDLVVFSCRIRGGYGQGIRVGGSGEESRRDRVIVRDSLMEDCYESGLTLNKVNGARVEASRFEHCRNGIQAASCRDVAIHAVTAIDNRRHGIAFRYSHVWHVNNCMATGNGGTETDQDKLRGWGIVAGGDPEVRHPPPNSDFTITNNICEDNYDGGITLDPTVANDPSTEQDETALIWAQRARVSGNVCRGRKDGEPREGEHPFGAHGIQVRNSSDVVVTDNNCYQNHNCGIAVVNSTHVLVQANACYENTNGIGIFSREDVTDAARHVIGVNMLYDNDEADLKGMR
jgi:parallel beta-helix repeat protein